MRNLTLSLMTALTLGLSACVQETEEPENASSQNPANTITGVDADNDGLRDDVQIHISKTYSGIPARKAVIQLAKAFQSVLVDGSAAPGALAATVSMNAAIDCLYSLDPEAFSGRVEDIEGVVVNTGARARAYARAGAFISGGSYSVSTVADNGAACKETP